jgi:hypothetical protein
MIRMTALVAAAAVLSSAAPAFANEYNALINTCTTAAKAEVGEASVRFNKFRTSGKVSRAWFTVRAGETVSRAKCEVNGTDAATITWLGDKPTTVAAVQ